MLLSGFATVLYFHFISSLNAASLPSGRVKRGITDDLLNDLQLFSQYAGAAYCEGNVDAANKTDPIACFSGNCPLVQDTGLKTMFRFQNSLVTDVTGFVARDDKTKNLIISFRGSYSVRNVLTDLNFGLTETGFCKDCRAHRGFLQSWQEARDDILLIAKALMGTHHIYRLVVVGHSLGAAIATLAAAELRTIGYNVTLYTFGSPRVGNRAFATFVSEQVGGNFRVTHDNDPIPRLPLTIMGFEHTTPEYFISNTDDEQVTISDVVLLQGAANDAGNAGKLITNFASHFWYFGSICACGLKDFDFEFRRA